MTGLIWTVQLVHYPTFAWIPADKFPAYPKFHAFRIFWITAIPMTLELAGAIWLFFVDTSELGLVNEWLKVNLFGVLALWLATLLVSMPLHNKIQKEYSLDACQQLARTNWIRTLIWTARSTMWLYLLYHLLGDVFGSVIRGFFGS